MKCVFDSTPGKPINSALYFMFTCLRVKIFSQVFLNFQVKKNEKKWKFVKFNQIFLNPTSGMPGPIRFLFGLENDI